MAAFLRIQANAMLLCCHDKHRAKVEFFKRTERESEGMKKMERGKPAQSTRISNQLRGRVSNSFVEGCSFFFFNFSYQWLADKTSSHWTSLNLKQNTDVVLQKTSYFFAQTPKYLHKNKQTKKTKDFLYIHFIKVQICEVSVSIYELRNLGSLGILIALVYHGRFLRVCKC